MDSSASKLYFLLFLMSILNVTTPGSFLSTANQFLHKRLNKPLVQTAQHDTIITIQPPITTLPTTPLTNPVTTPSTGISTPPIVTVPSANPTAPVTFPPATQNPIIPQIPVTNPVTTPSTTIPGVQQPVTNTATTYPSPTAGNDPTTTPVVVPPGAAATNGPTVPGQLWCIAKLGAPQMTTQAALDFACGMTDCSAIQQGGNCYNPNSLLNHASYAFNSYYQRNPMPTSCDFGGAAVITNVNPSVRFRSLHLHGRVILVSITDTAISGHNNSNRTNTNTHNRLSGHNNSRANTTNSISSHHNNSNADNSFSDHNKSNANADNTISSVTPPIVFNASSPFLGGSITGYGETPPAANISSASSSRPSNLQPLLGCIIVVTTIITWRTVLDV
ncbi:hypothetical protein OROHE_009892 [Orobanche hederae]